MVVTEGVGVDLVIGGCTGIFGNKVVFKRAIVDFCVGFIVGLFVTTASIAENVFLRLFDAKFPNPKLAKILVRPDLFAVLFGCVVRCFGIIGGLGLCSFGFDFKLGFSCAFPALFNSNGRMFFMMSSMLLSFDLVFNVGIGLVGVVNVDVFCVVVGFVGFVVTMVIADLPALASLLMMPTTAGSIFAKSF